jgi:hypothetical protein
MDRISRQRETDDVVHGIWRSAAAQEAIQAYAERVLHRG